MRDDVQLGNWNPNPKTAAIIKAVEGVLREAEDGGFRYTLRRVFYALVAAEHIPNTQQAYKSLSGTLDRARWEGWIPLDSLDDAGRVAVTPASWRSPREVLRSAAHSYRSDWWDDADPLIEVWAEKAAVGGILGPMSEDMGVTFLAARGFSSLTALSEAAYRWRNRNVEIIYVGDHDPSGLCMDNDLERRLSRLREEVLGQFGNTFVSRVALTMRQIEDLNIPPQPTKQSDSRAVSYGHEGSWELDAIPAADLVDIVRERIEEFLPSDFDHRKAQDEAQRQKIYELADRWQG